MEVWTPPCEDVQNKGETVQTEKVECVQTETSLLDDQKAWKCWKTLDSEWKSRSNKFVMGDSDKIPRFRARSKKVKTLNTFEVLGTDENEHEESLERDSAKDHGAQR